MDFTEVYRARAAMISPDGQHVLATFDNHIIVRQADTFQITHTWQIGSSASSQADSSAAGTSRAGASSSNSATLATPDSIQCEWSCDSRYILANCKGTPPQVQVFDIDDKDWSASIQIGIEGLTRAVWAPDGRTILCFSEWALRVTAWSLVTGKSVYIQFPKFAGRGFAFSRDTRYFVLAERHKSRDTMGIYDARNNYTLLRHFPLPTTSLASFALSPRSEYIAVWENPLEYRLYILNLTGDVLSSFTPDPDPGQGIRCVSWHPSKSMIAVSGWDDKVYILDTLSCRPIASFELKSRLAGNVILWREPTRWLETTHGRGFISHDRISTPTSLLIKHPASPVGPGGPTGGAVQVEWNLTGSLLLARWEHCGEAVHIYEFTRGSSEFQPALRTVVQHCASIRSARWDPVRGDSVVICSGGGALYLWRDSNADWVNDEEVAECVGIPVNGFTTLDVQWGPDGRSLVLQDKETFACAFVVEE